METDSVENNLQKNLRGEIMCDKLDMLTIDALISENKMMRDVDGQLCWIYNPELFEKYSSNPELRLR